MLPDISGAALAKRIRASSDVPIIMLTALGDTAQRVAGLEAGADDYIAKPFSSQELILRAKAIVRRTMPAPAASTPNRRIPRLGRYPACQVCLPISYLRQHRTDSSKHIHGRNLPASHRNRRGAISSDVRANELAGSEGDRVSSTLREDLLWALPAQN